MLDLHKRYKSNFVRLHLHHTEVQSLTIRCRKPNAVNHLIVVNHCSRRLSHSVVNRLIVVNYCSPGLSSIKIDRIDRECIPAFLRPIKDERMHSFICFFTHDCFRHETSRDLNYHRR